MVHKSGFIRSNAISPNESRPQASGLKTKDIAAGGRGAVRRLLSLLGPGLITGASDDDPSGIATYAMAGAAFGYSTLWTALITFPMMASVQYICAKIALVSGQGLSGVLRRHYSKKLLYPAVLALLLANTLNAGADIGAIASGVGLLLPVPAGWTMVLATLMILALQIWGSYRLIARVFKWLTLALFAYIGSALLAHPDWNAVIKKTFLPEVHFDSHFLSVLVAILGTTISPYLFFWQASAEVEEMKEASNQDSTRLPAATNTELSYAAWDINIGMFFSNLVMYFIILATAATLHRAGKTDIVSAVDAAQALEPLAGRLSKVLIAMGLIGSGLLTVPVLTTSAAFAVAEAFQWKKGLNQKWWRAKPFYFVILASTFAAVAINLFHLDPIKALFWTAIVNGLLAPPLLVVIMLIANNKDVLGRRTNSLSLNSLGWATTAAMFAAAVGMILTWGS